MGTMACAGAALAAPKVTFARSNDDSRPNFLWIDAEDMGPQLGCYGCDFMWTPNIDRLASEGVRFVNFGGPGTSCAPNRTSLITGMFHTSIGTQHQRCEVIADPTLKLLHDYFRAAGYYCANNKKMDYQGLDGHGMGDPTRWNAFGDTAHYDSRPNPDTSFLFQRNWGGTHEGQYWEPKDPVREDMVLPPYFPDTTMARRLYEKYLWNIEWMDFDGVGPLLDELDNKGLADNTIVFFSGDNGPGHPRSKGTCYDSGIMLPFIVRIPEKYRVDGQGEPGTVCDDLVGFADFLPTLLNLAGIPIPEHMQGQAFLGPNCPPPREYLYAGRGRGDERQELLRCVRDKRYKYIRNYHHWKEYYQYVEYSQHGMVTEVRRAHEAGELEPEQEMWWARKRPLEELYDLDKDPWELNNVIEDRAYGAVLKRMREAHVQWELDSRDLGFIPEGELDERAKSAGSQYKVGLRENGAEVRRAFEAARLLEKGEGGLNDLVEALGSNDSAVRYWAALGLGNVMDKAESAKPQLQSALNDSSPIVRVAAARSLSFMGDSQAVQKLIAEANNANNNEHVRIEALNHIDQLGNLAKPYASSINDTEFTRAKLVRRIHATIDDEPNYPEAPPYVDVATQAKEPSARTTRQEPVRCHVQGRRLVVRARSAQPVRASLYDARGKRVCTANIAAGQAQTLPAKRNLPAGTYVLRADAKGVALTRRVTVK